MVCCGGGEEYGMLWTCGGGVMESAAAGAQILRHLRVELQHAAG